MRKFYTLLTFFVVSLSASAQGWPENYGGVMLQAFFWDSFTESNWVRLTKRADEFSGYFDLVWIPQSGNCKGKSMGYDDYYWFPGDDHYNSSFGDEDQLRTLISTYKAKGIGTIADVVINHRKETSNWVVFPAETYKGTTYQLKSTDVCKNDDDGATKNWCDANGYTLSSNVDTGEGWGGMRDLDHKSTNVQNNCKAYTKMLIDDLGYTGFRYDMVKGYSASYTATYNNNAKPQFSVGECWDGTATICNWISGTMSNSVPTSAAFDFQFKYVCRNAFNANNMTKLFAQNDGNWPLNHKTTQTTYKSSFDSFRYAVTFVENHDTEKRPDGSSNGPLEKDTLAANAWMLANPGTPCVFLKHYMAYPNEIRAMIDARKTAGITNQSSYVDYSTNNAAYCGRAIKTNNANKLFVVVGSNTSGYTPATGTWVEVINGYHYKYFMAKALEIPFVDKASGEYDAAFKVKLTAVSATSGAQLVYTTNGTNPTATNGTKVSSGTQITISQPCTLKVALYKNNAVSGTITRVYTFKEEKTWEQPDCATYVDGKIFAYFENSQYWSKINVWAWGNFNNQGASNSNNVYPSWPGSSADVTKVGTNPSTDYDVYLWQYTPTSVITATSITGIIFNDGSSQTGDLDFVNGGYYNYEKRLATITQSTGINDITADSNKENQKVYTIDGKYLGTKAQLPQLQKGIYIIGNKKYIVK